MSTSLVRAVLATSLAAIGIVGVPAPPTHALEYDLYVSETGTDSGNCPAVSPCATVTYALSLAGFGATVHVSGRIHDHIFANLPHTIITGEGASSPAILDGSGTATVLHSQGVDIQLRSLRIEHGYGSKGVGEGGGIYNYGHLTLTDVTVADNATLNGGGGINNYGGDLTLIRSTVTGNTSEQWLGGGIYTTSAGNTGPVHIYDSTISGNHADGQSGGGIWGADASSPVTIVRSTISGNSAATGAGVAAKVLTVIDSTLSGNSSGQGSAIQNFGAGGSAKIVSSTIAGNSGGPALYSSTTGAGATVTLGGTILAGNSANFGSNCAHGANAYISAGYNLTDDDGVSCGMIGASDRVGTDPGLGSLQNNGGHTFTMFPSGAGAARVIPQGTLLAGVQGCQGQDQRTDARPQDGQTMCTSGAVEPGPTAAAAPHVTSASSATVNAGAPFTIPITATGTPTPVLTATSLPAGVSFTDHHDGTATLSGSTSAVGNNVINLSAWNGVDPADEPTFTLTVHAVFNPTYVAVSDATMVEGNSSAHDLTFTLTRSGQTGGASSVKVSTTDVSATAGIDYTALPSTTVSFPAGVTTRTVTVSVNGDTAIEPSETIRLNLFTPVGATITDTRGIGTILNDDSTYVSVSDATVTEGASGTRNVNFTLTRSGSTAGAASVKVGTSNGTAVSSSDYNALATTTVSFAAGEKFKTVSVGVKGDVADESNETFKLKLWAPVGATITDTSGTATIVDDDGVPDSGPTTFLTVSDSSVVERNSGVATAIVTVTRSGDVSGTTWVDVTTADGSAKSSDYSPVGATLMFNPGDKTKTVGINVTGDRLLESDETVLLHLTGPIGGEISDPWSTTTILNDDAITIGVSDAWVVEGNAGTTMVFTLRRTGSLDGTSSVTVTTADGSATAGSDYDTRSKVIAFAAGQATRTFSVTVTGDGAAEGNETLIANLTAPVRASVSDAAGTGTIVNDD